MDGKLAMAAAIVLSIAASGASGPGRPAGPLTQEVRAEHSTRIVRASGVVVDKPARRGKRVPACADFPKDWAALIAAGMPAEARLHPSNPGTFGGNVLSVAAGENSPSKALQVCFELRDAKGRLKPGDYLEFLVRIPQSRLCVPPGAVVYPGEGPEVFVVSGPGRLEPRAVEVRSVEGDCLEVISGLREGEVVAASGAEVSGP